MIRRVEALRGLATLGLALSIAGCGVKTVGFESAPMPSATPTPRADSSLRYWDYNQDRISFMGSRGVGIEVDKARFPGFIMIRIGRSAVCGLTDAIRTEAYAKLERRYEQGSPADQALLDYITNGARHCGPQMDEELRIKGLVPAH